MCAKLTFTVQSHVAELVVDAPKTYNALDASLLDEFREAVRRLEETADVRVALVKSALPKSFLSGADIAYMERSTLADSKQFIDKGWEVFRALEACSKPVIAVINGYCLGGGLELALACDIRIASASAKFGFPEVKLGIVPGWGGLSRAPRQIGMAKAKELMFTGRMYTAEEALRMGLVNQVIEDGALPGFALDMARGIAANAPLAVGLVKRWMPAAAQGNGPEGMAIAAHATLACCLSQDRREGMRAFLEKRPPLFLGQ